MPFRLLENEVAIIRSAIDKSKIKNKSYKIPLVMPIVLYTGKQKWNANKYLERRHIMSGTIKSEHELEKMREAGRILGIVLDDMAKIIRPGISTMDINRKGEEVIRSFGCIPSFLNYNGYPASICVSVNDEVVHGIPSKKRILQEGDIVSLDAGVIYEGYHSDAARTHGVGEISPEAQRIIDVT